MGTCGCSPLHREDDAQQQGGQAEAQQNQARPPKEVVPNRLHSTHGPRWRGRFQRLTEDCLPPSMAVPRCFVCLLASGPVPHGLFVLDCEAAPPGKYTYQPIDGPECRVDGVEDAAESMDAG